MMGILRQYAAIATGQNHRQAGVALADDGRKLNAGHSRHDDVGKYQIERQLIRGDQR